MNVNLTPNITGKNVNIIKGATQADLTNSVNNSKFYRDEAEAFSIVSEAKSIEASYSALNASINSTTASDKATIATTKANEANNSAINASASEAVCIAKATITTDKANIATAQSVIATDKANEASISANTATTQAGIATTKASEASISASNALTSENNADTSEANALIYRNQAESFANSINPSDLVHISGTETITGNKTFSGIVSGLTKATVGLSNVDNTADSTKSVSYATTAGTASASDVYSWAKAVSKPSYTASEVGLGNVTNESKDTMFTSPTFTGTVTLPSSTSIGNVSSTELGYIDGVTSSIQTQLDSKVAKVTSTDNAIVRFNGTTGDVQNSGVIIDVNNNVGIGATPSAWTSNTAIQMQQGTSFSGYGNSTMVMKNAYYDGAFKYVLTGYAQQYEQNLFSGAHNWRTATSGTAGNVITWTNAMTLGANGNLLVGTTTDNGVDKVQVNGIASALRFRSNRLSISAVAGTWVNISTLGNGLHVITQSDYNSAVYGACMIVLVAEGTAFIVLNTGPAIILRMSGLVAQLNFPITMPVGISITTLN